MEIQEIPRGSVQAPSSSRNGVDISLLKQYLDGTILSGSKAGMR
jgi:hypothetical protein